MQKTLLLVDDEPNILNALKRDLKDQEYTILTASNGQQALQLLADHEVQVVISDHRMPCMLGTDLLAIIHTLYPKTVRMILSAYSDFEVIKTAINEGAIFKYINKPWDSGELKHYTREAFTLYLQQHDMEEQLLQLIYQDSLTSLSNGYRFNKELVLALKRAKVNHSSLLLIIVDIDRFKDINEALGNQIGDSVLKQFAKRLSTLWKNAIQCARLGNDEFALLIEHPQCSTQAIIKEVFQKLTMPVRAGHSDIYLTVSGGVSRYPDFSSTHDMLIKHANLALRYCKKRGGNAFHYYDPDKMAYLDEEQFMFRSDIHKALENNELTLFYQSINDTVSGQITDVEVLLRWQHPKYGLLTSDKFIHFCEEIGVIVEIGEWVLLTACQQLKQWHDLGFENLHISVNLSARQFYSSKLYDTLKKVIKKTRINPNQLVLEITESMLMENFQENITLMQLIKSLGIQFSIDDFGTGYSSLSYLNQFPFNYLKIDQSFVINLSTKKENKSIIAAIIALAKHLGLTTIAEGVEIKKHRDILRELNCNRLQGYLFCKPMPAVEFTEYLVMNKS